MLVCHVLYANGDSAEKQIEANMFLHKKWWLEIDCEKNHCSVSVCKASVSVSVGEARTCSEELKLVLQKVPSELYPKVCNHGEGPY